MTTQIGTTNSDNIFGQNGDDILEGNSGDDLIFGGNNDDLIEGGTGDDTIVGGNHDDILEGGTGDDTIVGGYHDDVLKGDSGDDILEGGYHNDVLYGGSGNDSLFGGTGSDTLIGGDGADSFIFTSLDSLDLISDFDSSQGDKIIFDSSTTEVFEISDLTVHIGSSYINTLEPDSITSIYVDGERIIEFDDIVSLQIEDFEFI